MNFHNDRNITQKKPRYHLEDIIGEDSKIIDLKILAKRAASTDSPVLIYGETGTGKELFAQSIHNASGRDKKPFVAINCAAIPETLLESILFGTVEGAYTEAIDRQGLFEQSSEGTLFLDEINSMPLMLQAKLLRALQEKKIRRVGGMTDIPVYPRIISSVNVKPFEAIEKGLLRSDLFYRLGVVCLEIPPLRERISDLNLLIEHFLREISSKLGKKNVKVSPDLIEVFKTYSWSGNIRQLEHAIECALTVIGDSEEEITIEHIPEYMKYTSAIINENKIKKDYSVTSLKSEMAQLEKNKILTVLEKSQGNISLAAKLMNISRQSLHYRLKKYQINVSK